MANDEVRQHVNIEYGSSLRIKRGDLAGWIVEMDARPGYIGRTAAFSDSDALMEWLKGSFELSRTQSPPEQSVA